MTGASSAALALDWIGAPHCSDHILSVRRRRMCKAIAAMLRRLPDMFPPGAHEAQWMPRFAHEDVLAGEHVVALDEWRHPHGDGLHRCRVAGSPSTATGSVDGLESAATPLPLLGANAPAGRVCLASNNRTGRRSGKHQYHRVVIVFSAHMIDHNDRNNPQFVFTASDEPYVRSGVQQPTCAVLTLAYQATCMRTPSYGRPGLTR